MIHLLFLALLTCGFSHAQDLYKEVAQKYAPIVIQGLGANPDADQFTRVDFDGDWDPNNNWDNMPKFERPATVYWHVVESEKSFFITYAFFFPRDYASWCFWIHCHENDFEGMRVTVAKPSKVVKVEALAHNFHGEVLNPEKVEVVIEKEGHGIHPAGTRKPDAQHRRYLPSDYELRPLDELWAHRKQLFTGKFTFKGKTYPSNFGGKKWILFGMGAAKPAWSWEVWASDYQKGEWFLDPLRGSDEKYISSMVMDEAEDNLADNEANTASVK